MIMERPREPTITYGVYLDLAVAEVPTTTGRRGRIHGARTVSIPAKNETMRRIMGYFTCDTSADKVGLLLHLAI